MLLACVHYRQPNTVEEEGNLPSAMVLVTVEDATTLLLATTMDSLGN
jgi:hypothetical protein